MYKSKNNWKIYDVEIEGISIISTYRSQFDQVLSKGTIDELLQKLEKPENK
jgi:phospholipid transport system substrate-binding protein